MRVPKFRYNVSQICRNLVVINALRNQVDALFLVTDTQGICVHISDDIDT